MKPSEMLLGKRLNNRWTVIKQVTKKKNATGGNFSTGYIVQDDAGQKGFLKAMDYTDAFHSANTPLMLQMMTQAYLFEKQICEQCKTKKMQRVVHAIDSGSINPQPTHSANKVEFLIFELAKEDIRTHLDTMAKLDHAFILRTLRQVATGIQQLHNAWMAHQDLKPSNVLVFAADTGSKIADLGRAWSRDLQSPYDGVDFAGDPTHGPIEAYYNYSDGDIQTKKFGADFYMLGSLIVFLFSRVTTNALFEKYLAVEHQPHQWGGTYPEVMPYLNDAFSKALAEFSGILPDYLRADLCEMVTQLCDPDPAKRGPRSPFGIANSPSLQRYISKFDLLAYQSETQFT